MNGNVSPFVGKSPVTTAAFTSAWPPINKVMPMPNSGRMAPARAARGSPSPTSWPRGGARARGVHAELEVVARDRVRVAFANPGSATARGVTARVYLPPGADTARVESGPRLRASPLLRISADHTWIEVVERSLDPGAEVSYTIRF